VETQFFASFESDILLSPEWWHKIPRHVWGHEKVAVAHGIRSATNPVLRKLGEF
jgi:hypothetical protein